MDGGHDTADDGSVIVERLSHGSEAVGGAGRGGDDVIFLGERLVVDVVNDGRQIVARGSGDDDLLGASLDVSGSLFLLGVEAGAFEHDVDAQSLPRQLFGVGFRIYGDVLAVNGYGAGGDDFLAVFAHHRVGIGNFVIPCVIALHGVILEQMSEHLGAGEVVDSDYLIALGAEHLPESQTSDTAETVDCNSYVLCHNVVILQKILSFFYQLSV